MAAGDGRVAAARARRQWQAEFEKYQAIPQYRELNAGMSLAAFKTIFWWEWTHRLLGRLIGAAFLLPFLWFLWRGWVAPALRPRLWLIFGLGALQGAVGWWMVASGLADRVEVSQYRLATHLVLACVIYVALIWTAQRLARATVPAAPAPRAHSRRARVGLLVLVLVQIYLGALVAGLRAGYVYNTWPLIDGAFVPDAARLFFDTPLWRNFFENTLTVQFDHRMLAYAILSCALLHAFDVARTRESGPGARRRRRIVRRADAAGGARHLDAAAAAPLAARAAASGDGDAGLDRGDHARGECYGGYGAGRRSRASESHAPALRGVAVDVPALAQSASACSRSAMMSSLSSMPIDSRTTSGPAPASIFCASVSWRCVVEAG